MFLRVLLLLLVVVMMCLMLEGVLAFNQRFLAGLAPYSEENIAAYVEGLDLLAGVGEQEVASGMVHPYLGMICNYDVILPHKGMPNNRFGFFSEVDAIYQPRHSNEFVVVVLGGSVAAQMCIVAGDYLKESLQSLPGVEGREVVINSLAQGGYKQPQQLLNFAYHSTLGMHADLVLNLDGVNEMIFFERNNSYGVDPSFPWNWLAIAEVTERDVQTMRWQLGIVEQRARRARLAQWMLRRRLYRSMLGRTIHRRVDIIWANREQYAERELDAVLARRAEDDLPFSHTGPVYWSSDEFDAVLEESARLWRRAGIALHEMVRARDIPYMHGLQPNQYFPGTRTLSGWEESHAYNTNTIYYRPLRYGYAFFTNEIPRLREAGVPIVNVSEHMADPPQSIYEDDLSHFNELGNHLLVDAVLASLRQTLFPEDAHAP